MTENVNQKEQRTSNGNPAGAETKAVAGFWSFNSEQQRTNFCPSSGSRDNKGNLTALSNWYYYLTQVTLKTRDHHWV
jgi:hypothetical protein